MDSLVTTPERSGPSPGPRKPPPADPPAVPRIDSRTWFSHHRVVEIDHRGAIYRLRCTSQGKLILSK